MSLWGTNKPKRSLGIRDRQILWIKSGKKCENCGKTLEFHEMQPGHKKAYAKGGPTTMKNSVCLCYACNKLQGTDTWETFQKKQGKQVKDENPSKTKLKNLTLTQLKHLTKEKNIKLKGKTKEGFFKDTYTPPSKTLYVKALAPKISEKEIETTLKKMPVKTSKPRKKKKTKKNPWTF